MTNEGSARHELFTEGFKQKYLEIERLLTEAYKHQYKSGECNWKNSEGWIQIDMPEYFWAEGQQEERPRIMVYSYALGPYRAHHFHNIDEALAVIKQWHKNEMEHDYTQDDVVWKSIILSD